MAEGSSDLEKTESATPKRLERAREEGDVPRSRELSTCVTLLATGAAFWFTGRSLMRSLDQSLTDGLSFDHALAFDSQLLLNHLGANLGSVLLAFAPLALLVVAVAVLAPVLLGGWVFTAKAFAPKLSRLSPFTGIGNIFSTHAAVELAKAIGKTVIVGSIAVAVAMSEKDAVLGLALEPLGEGSAHLCELLLVSFIAISSGLLLIAVIDAPYQLWHHANKLKMTREEIRQEAKESDGDPQIKSRIRARQREMARRRMMSEVPKADVIVTNPTHFAVALKYDEGVARAPRVVAKGADEIAAKIRELGAAAGVPLLEAPPLARALYRHAELGDEIPQALYTAVAEVLAYVFQLRAFRGGGGVRPVPPTDLDVPADLDPAMLGTPA